MPHFSIRTLTPIFFGVLVYLLAGCTALFPQKNTSHKTESFAQDELKKKIRIIDKKINNNPPNADLFYQKGYLLSELAQKKNEPADRAQIFASMHSSLKQAEELFQKSNLPSGKQKVDDLLKVRWSNEHNQGVQIVQNDSTLSAVELKKAVAHFNNATIILPDTAISYRLKAETLYKNGDIEPAINTLNEAKKNISPLPSNLLEQLAFLYLKNDDPIKAVEVYEQAKAFSEDNLNLIHGLANAYIVSGQHQKAVSLIDILIENEPENIIYRQTKGTELYFLANQKIAKLTSSAADSSTTQNVLAEIDSLLSNVEYQLQKIAHDSPNNLELKTNLVIFYQNSASRYQSLLSVLTDEQSKIIDKRIDYYLEQSIPLYKSLLQQNPDSKELRSHLFTTYTYLGMNDEAQKIKTNL